jgi:hypothetical protein
MDRPTRLLVLAGEDFTGLWDVASESLDVGSHAEKSARELAGDALRVLLDEALIDLFTRRSAAWDFDPIPPSEVGAVLQVELAWEAPADSDAAGRVYIAATPRGLERLRQASWGESE